jgi:amino acid adenylation domain-containing protein
MKVSEPTFPIVRPDKSFEEFQLSEIEQSVGKYFEKQVEKYRDALAVKKGEKELSYGKLNEFANKIAHGILGKVGNENISIALLFEQGINFLGAIFGALKAGKCYVPIDPTFPDSRNQYILDNSQAHLIVTNTTNLEIAQALSSGQYEILNIDDLESSPQIQNPDINVSPDALAYIIYTSGSTGKPKGVFQNHRNLLHNAMNQINTFHLGLGDRMPLVHSCSVMGAVRATYNALLSGTALYPFDVKNQGLDELRILLQTEKITVFHAVATLFRHFADIFKDVEAFSSLRLVILGGEAMYRKDVEFYKQKFPDQCLLCTGLGSTEAGTTRIFMLNKQTEITTAQVPPGYAVEGLKVVLWNEEGGEVPLGEVGEIVIESEYLALGYWQQHETNLQTFAPISPTSSIRRFRTGDLGKFLPDGCLVHMGRKDFQVKIRGYRVDVAEVEMTLMDSGLLKEVVVVGKALIQEEISLIAYCVLKEPSSNTIAKQLRHIVRQKLTDYMVPAAFVFLDALPLTPNGKVDRKALPTPSRESHAIGAEFVAPRTSLEQEIAKIWCDLLELDRIGIHENFFDLGGHSLLAAQFFAEIEQTSGKHLPLALLTKAPTIAEVAELIQQDDWSSAWSSLVPLQPHGDRPPLFLSHGIAGNVLDLQPLASEMGLDQPVYGLQAQGLDGESLPLESIEAIAAHNIQTLRSVQTHGPYFLGGYSFGGTVAFEMARQLEREGHTVALLVLFDSYTPEESQKIQDNPAPFLSRLKTHWNRFSKQGGGYIIERWNDRVYRSAFFSQWVSKLVVSKDGAVSSAIQTSERVKRVNMQAKRNYTTHFYPGKITLFRAVPGRTIREGWQVDSVLGWSDLSASLEVHNVAGDHGSFLRFPNVVKTAEILQRYLQEAALIHSHTKSGSV